MRGFRVDRFSPRLPRCVYSLPYSASALPLEVVIESEGRLHLSRFGRIFADCTYSSMLCGGGEGLFFLLSTCVSLSWRGERGSGLAAFGKGFDPIAAGVFLLRRKYSSCFSVFLCLRGDGGYDQWLHGTICT